MHTLRCRVVSVLIGLLASSTLARAGHAAPLGTAFTYQGQLTNSGAPATGIYDLELAITMR